MGQETSMHYRCGLQSGIASVQLEYVEEQGKWSPSPFAGCQQYVGQGGESQGIEHPKGALLVIDAESAKAKYLARMADQVCQQRGVLWCADEKAAQRVLKQAADFAIVCLLASRSSSVQMQQFVRTPQQRPCLRSIPLITITRLEAVQAPAAQNGSVVEMQLESLAARVLSLPSRPTMQSEPGAASFQGLMSDVRFGHFLRDDCSAPRFKLPRPWATRKSKSKSKDSEKDWVFSDNRQYMLQSMHQSRMEWYPRVERYDEHIVEVASYMQGLQPVHRCKPGVLLAILREGGLMSRTELESLLSADESTSAAVRRTARHVRLQELTRRQDFIKFRREVFKYAEAMCVLKELQSTAIRLGDKVTHEGRRAIVIFFDLDQDSEARRLVKRAETALSQAEAKWFNADLIEAAKQELQEAREWLQECAKVKIKYDDDDSESSYLKMDEMTKFVDPEALSKAKLAVAKTRPAFADNVEAAKVLEVVISEVVEDVLASSGSSLTGIGYGKDKELGTNRHVFATLGLNRQFEYGSVVIFLNRSLLYHPDTWVSPLAATGFLGPYFWGYRHRPWTGAALVKLAADCDPGTGYAKVEDTPENDEKGVVSCILSSVNMAAVEGWPYICARDMDAMCHYLAYEHRNAHAFDDGSTNCGLDWQEGSIRRKAAAGLLDNEKKQVLPGAWSTVVEYYESKNSHTLFECHLPSFIPLGAIDKICISDDLYQRHSEVQDKVKSFILPDGRRLADLIVMTKSKEECMSWQHDWFDELRRGHLAREQKSGGKTPVENSPISVCLAGQGGRPVFLPPDFGAWFASSSDEYHAWKAARSTSLNVSFCCRALHDIRVFFSSSAECQRSDADLRDNRWKSTTYHICIGAKNNKESYITKGLLGTRHQVHHTWDVLKRCVAADQEGDYSLKVWERYWFQVLVTGGQAVVSCGSGPLGTNVMMQFEDADPIQDLKYIGLGCWNEPTTFCDVRAVCGADNN